MTRLPFTISNQSLTFFVKGRPYSLTRDHESYAAARAHLLQTEVEHDVQMLVEMTDARASLLRQSHGRIVFDGNEILFGGKSLHNVWVDKIFELRSSDEDFSPFWNALDRLVHNPTPAAIERLPIFLERTKLGFLPDGRFIAFKGVAADLRSCRANLDGSYFTHEIGAKPRMERHFVDPNPDQTCSYGLHVGAPGYVKSYYSGQGKQVVLVAVDPVDVVSVPTDYNGEKMRVCGYEVIDHLEREWSDELLGRLQGPTAYSGSGWAPAAPAETSSSIAHLAQIGDTVTVTAHEDIAAGSYEVVGVDPNGDGYRLQIGVPSDWLDDDCVTEIVRNGEVIAARSDIEDEDDEDDVEPYDQIKVDDVIMWNNVGADLWSRVVSLDPVTVLNPEGATEHVTSDEFEEVVDADMQTAAMLVYDGCSITLQGDEAIRDGQYIIAGLDEDGEDLQSDDLGCSYKIFLSGHSGATAPIVNQDIKEVFAANGTQLWPRTKVEVSGDTVTMTSLDGHDLRGEAETLVTTEEFPVDHTWIQPALQAQVGDLVEIVQGGWPPAGIYPVVRVDEGCEYRLTVRTEHDGDQGVLNTYVTAVTARPWMRAEIGGYVTIVVLDGGSSFVPAGRYEVMDVVSNHPSNGTPQVQIRVGNHGGWWIDAERVTAVEPKA